MNSEKSPQKKDENKITKEVLKFRFLEDDPIAEDFFGSHIRIAESIASRIELDTKGKTVGLGGIRIDTATGGYYKKMVVIR